MGIEVEPIVRSQTITWMKDGYKPVCKVEVVDGDYTDPEAIEIQHILESQREFNQFIRAIRKALKDTA